MIVLWPGPPPHGSSVHLTPQDADSPIVAARLGITTARGSCVPTFVASVGDRIVELYGFPRPADFRAWRAVFLHFSSPFSPEYGCLRGRSCLSGHEAPHRSVELDATVHSTLWDMYVADASTRREHVVTMEFQTYRTIRRDPGHEFEHVTERCGMRLALDPDEWLALRRRVGEQEHPFLR